jgi:hypothetical protein
VSRTTVSVELVLAESVATAVVSAAARETNNRIAEKRLKNLLILSIYEDFRLKYSKRRENAEKCPCDLWVIIPSWSKEPVFL